MEFKNNLISEKTLEELKANLLKIETIINVSIHDMVIIYGRFTIFIDTNVHYNGFISKDLIIINNEKLFEKISTIINNAGLNIIDDKYLIYRNNDNKLCMSITVSLPVIDKFNGNNYYLSNFSQIPLEFAGIKFQNSEAAFQSMKCKNKEDRIKFSDSNPSLAKRRGRSIELRDDWETVKEQIMYSICLAKFSQNSSIGKKLISTFPHILIEGNTWGDTEWGVSNGMGENKLGLILMKVREDLPSLTSSYKGDEYI